MKKIIVTIFMLTACSAYGMDSKKNDNSFDFKLLMKELLPDNNLAKKLSLPLTKLIVFLKKQAEQAATMQQKTIQMKKEKQEHKQRMELDREKRYSDTFKSLTNSHTQQINFFSTLIGDKNQQIKDLRDQLTNKGLKIQKLKKKTIRLRARLGAKISRESSSITKKQIWDL